LNYKYNQGTTGKNFQGKEGKAFKVERQLDLGLNLDMTKFRMYDYALGRFTSIDPLADANPQESWTPYQYAYNSPVQYNDPYGDCPWCIGALVGAAIGAAVEYGSQVYDNYQSGMTISNAMTTNIDGAKIGGAAVRGLITGAVATATGGTSLVTQVGANAVGEVTGGMADRAISGEKVLDGGEILTDAIAGGAGGALAKGGEKLFDSNVVKNATEVVIERVGSIATKKVVQPIVKKVVKTAIVSGGRAGAKAGVNKTSDSVDNSQNEGSSTQNDSSSKSNIEDRK
jgi:RHS repeat-associated protein